VSASYSSLMQSDLYHPAFNSAIFDGAIRIYFSQSFESFALKVYFVINQKLHKELSEYKKIYQSEGRLLIILLYPEKNILEQSFKKQKVKEVNLQGNIFQTWMDEDKVFATSPGFDDEKLKAIVNEVELEIRNQVEDQMAAAAESINS